MRSWPWAMMTTPVSIHAPLRGATEDPKEIKKHVEVSIHAPLRGATHRQRWTQVQAERFNPRTPAGCDIDGEAPSWSGLSFNPRTPAGCDSAWSSLVLSRLGFNPRTPAGCDLAGTEWDGNLSDVSIHAPLRGATLISNGSSLIINAFQSTHPCGVRRGSPALCCTYPGFNPRTPAGCDVPPPIINL